jgi:hypothetical protein
VSLLVCCRWDGVLCQMLWGYLEKEIKRRGL